MPTFVPGWTPAFAARAQARLMATGRFCLVVEDGTTPPPVWSLGKFCLGEYTQGNAGTCHAHAVKDMAEVSAGALGYKAFKISRRLVGWEGCQLEDGHNQADGGSPTDNITGMSSAGIGIAHEDLWPYTDDRNALALPPPANVLQDAAKSHLVAPVPISSFDQMKKMIASGRPVSIGIWWPYNWDDHQTVMTTVGQGEFGHALNVIGYAGQGIVADEEAYQLRNWHTRLYPPLTPAQAARVPGYLAFHPDLVTDFWVIRSALSQVIRKGGAELVSATDYDGISRGVVQPSSGADFSDSFSVM